MYLLFSRSYGNEVANNTVHRESTNNHTCHYARSSGSLVGTPLKKVGPTKRKECKGCRRCLRRGPKEVDHALAYGGLRSGARSGRTCGASIDSITNIIGQEEEGVVLANQHPFSALNA